jgi:membrane-associated phospholipid phosphatase
MAGPPPEPSAREPSALAPASIPAGRPSRWLAAGVAASTGLLFMVVYHTANAYAARAAARGEVGTWHWEWELGIPLVPWLIIPYWSIDLLFVVAPFLCTTRSELFTLAGRLALATLVAGLCFVVWPLQLGFERASDHGVLTPLFTALHGMDRPHNLFPSLHVTYAFILRWTFDRHLSRWPRAIFHVWFACISVSAVLVHQHHLVDVAGAIVLAFACFYIVSPGSLRPGAHRMDARAAWAAAWFAAAGAALAALAWWMNGWAWLLAWPAASLLLVALGYAVPRAQVFRKRAAGVPLASRVALAPYLIGLGATRRHWWSRDPHGAALVADGVWIGRVADAAVLQRCGASAVLDVTAEHGVPGRTAGLTVECVPMMDLATPSQATLARCAQAIEELRARGPVLVQCGLGYGRSAAAVAAWLLATGRAASVDAAIARIRAARPACTFGPSVRTELAKMVPAVPGTIFLGSAHGG